MKPRKPKPIGRLGLTPSEFKDHVKTLERGVKVATPKGNVRGLTQTEIAKKLGVTIATVGRYSILSPQERRSRRRIALSEKMTSKLTLKVRERIEELASRYVGFGEGREQHTRKLTAVEIAKILRREGRALSSITVATFLRESGLRTPEELKRIALEVTRRKLLLPMASDLKLVEELLTSPKREVSINMIPAYVREHGQGTITKRDVASVSEGLKETGRFRSISRKAKRTNLFTSEQKAEIIKKWTRLIFKVAHRLRFVITKDTLPDVRAHLMNALDYYDPKRGTISTFIGMCAKYYLLDEREAARRAGIAVSVEDITRPEKGARFIRHPKALTTLPADLASVQPTRSQRYEPFFTQPIPRNLAGKKRAAVQAYLELARESLSEGNFPSFDDVARALDPENPTTRQNISHLLESALKKYKK